MGAGAHKQTQAQKSGLDLERKEVPRLQKCAYKIIIGSWETGEQGKREHSCREVSQVVLFNASQKTESFSPNIFPMSLLLLLYIPQLQYEFLEVRG